MNKDASRNLDYLSHEGLRKQFIFDAGLFLIFFFFYVGVALIQTPPFEAISSIQVVNMPLGLILSLLIFPVSWAIIIVWFWRGR